MDTGHSINALENALRDLIERVLKHRHGPQWIEHLGVTAERRAGWEARREVERKTRTAASIDERLLYYADFTDLLTIIKANWDPDFRACFGKRAELETYLTKLAYLRNPDAHSRSLLHVEEQLVEGITGELRQKITIFLSDGHGGPEPEHFARIEQIVDSFGHRVTGVVSGEYSHGPELVLRPGDRVVFRGDAWDPQGAPLTWKLFFMAAKRSEEHVGSRIAVDWMISDADISEQSSVSFSLVSARPYVRLPGHSADDTAAFAYKVLPGT